MSDLIDRQAVLDEIDKRFDLAKSFKQLIKSMPSVKPEPCTDAISRQAVLDKEVYTETSDGWTGWTVDVNDIKALPPVKPEQKVGRWIEREDAFGDTFYNCSACGEMWSTIDGNPWDNGMDYCPNCGAKMVETQESEVVYAKSNN